MNQDLSTLRKYRYHEVVIGMREAHDYVLTPEVYQHFLGAFHDYSPVHVDEEFAKARGFSGKVMHGSLLNGFISHFVGMQFPGQFGLLLSVDLRYLNPSYLDDTVHLEAVVSQKMDARNVVILDVTLANTTRGYLAARGRLQVMLQEAP